MGTDIRTDIGTDRHGDRHRDRHIQTWGQTDRHGDRQTDMGTDIGRVLPKAQRAPGSAFPAPGSEIFKKKKIFFVFVFFASAFPPTIFLDFLFLFRLCTPNMLQHY